jgi:hypothetical protein
MKALLIRFSLLVATVFFISLASQAQTKTSNSNEMKTYVIEREIQGAGDFTGDQLKSISQTSCGVLKQMNDIQWLHSYVTGNKIYCVYKAKNEELIREHAKKGGFPANKISEVANVISPATAE